MKITTEVLNRFAKIKSIALSALAVAALASTPALAGNNDEEELKFDMVRNPGLTIAGFPNFLPNARGRVKIESVGPVEIMDVKVEGLPPQDSPPRIRRTLRRATMHYLRAIRLRGAREDLTNAPWSRPAGYGCCDEMGIRTSPYPV
jgi:hypothetical protein